MTWPTVTLNDPVDEALLVGNKDGASAPSGVVQLATLHLELQPGAAGVTLISGTVAGQSCARAARATCCAPHIAPPVTAE